MNREIWKKAIFYLNDKIEMLENEIKELKELNKTIEEKKIYGEY